MHVCLTDILPGFLLRLSSHLTKFRVVNPNPGFETCLHKTEGEAFLQSRIDTDAEILTLHVLREAVCDCLNRATHGHVTSL